MGPASLRMVVYLSIPDRHHSTDEPLLSRPYGSRRADQLNVRYWPMSITGQAPPPVGHMLGSLE